MKKPITMVIGGLGVRGYEVYASYAYRHPQNVTVVAVADPDPEKRAAAKERFHLPDSACYPDMETLLQQTQDRQHIAHALPALEKGYHLLLEKPISPDVQACIALRDTAHRCGRVVAVAHVLRYTEIFSAVKQLLQQGAIGKLIHMDLIENVAYWHFAHSYVRGNWRRAEETSPMILAKSCHDMDILRWLADAPCESLSSVGGLSVFTGKNAPTGAADRCLNCAVERSCPYSARRIYLENEKTGVLHGNTDWPCSVLDDHPTEQSITRALAEGPYGRCVYACDNDVADHQCVSMAFENGVCATFTVTAFTAECCRSLRAMGSLGELEIDMLNNRIMVRRFGEAEEVLNLEKIRDKFAGHGGGDDRMMDAFVEMLADGGTAPKTSIDVSVDSHIMAMAAEHSRLCGGQNVRLRDFAAQNTAGGCV